jgi:hypothetical protein
MTDSKPTSPLPGGISKAKTQENEPVKAPKKPSEDSRMSLSHLLLKGYVIGSVKSGKFEAVFKSLNTREVQDVDKLVILSHGVTEHRAATSARYMKYLSMSLSTLSIEMGEGEDKTFWDFSELDAAAKEEALAAMSSFVFNGVLSLYQQFEDNIIDLLKDVTPKNF